MQSYILLFAMLRLIKRGDVFGRWRRRLEYSLVFTGLISIAIALLVPVWPESWFHPHLPVFSYYRLKPLYRFLPDPESTVISARMALWAAVFGSSLFLRI